MPKQKQKRQLSKTLELPPGVKLGRTIEGQAVVWSIAFDPRGQTLASGSRDNKLNLWDVASGKLLRTFKGHEKGIYSVAFDPMGQTLASGSSDNTVKLWEVASGRLLRTLEGHKNSVRGIAFNPIGQTLASGSVDKKVLLWKVASGKLFRSLEGHEDYIYSVAFDPAGLTLASGSRDETVNLWDVSSGKLVHTLKGHQSNIFSVAFAPTGLTLASASDDNTVKLWEVASGKLLRTLEGHTQGLDAVAFSVDGRLLASKSIDGTMRLWSCETWDTVAVIRAPTHSHQISSLAFHPTLPLLITSGSESDKSEGELSGLLHLWELDFDILLGKVSEARPAIEASHYTTAKIVLVGDSGVGKTGLGWRLAHGEFKEHASTHGQQFWVINELGARRQDGTECEAILWDLAGQPDYRLTHALFLDDSDLALILFDPTDSRDPLHGVEFWLKQIRTGNKKAACQTILVGARADRGEARLTKAELDEFCRQRGILGGYLPTSAKDEIGLDELLQRMKARIPWNEKPATVTTLTFKRIKDYVLKLDRFSIQFTG